MPDVYEELRRLAAHYLRGERQDHTLQATSLVHEAYLRLAQQREVDFSNRVQFIGLAASLMRRILVNHANARLTAKRGGGAIRVLSGCMEDVIAAPSAEEGVDLLQLDAALEELATAQPVHARIVELRFFGGLTFEEVAELLGVSERTVQRHWRTARAWLFDRLRQA